FNDTQAIRGTEEIRLVGEICCLDHESIALPMTAGIPLPLTHVLSEMGTAVKGDHANLVNHFVENRDISGSLDNLNIIVIRARKHRRAGIETLETTLDERSILHGVSAEWLSSRLARLRPAGNTS